MKIKLQLKDIVKDEDLIELCGLNPYCVNEGADGDDFIEIETKDILIYEIYLHSKKG